MKHLRSISLLAALAVSAFAGTASAAIDPNLPSPSDPAFAVPAGKVEHTVTVVKVFGTKAVPRHERVEMWLGRERGRTVITDVKTGRISREITYRPGESRVFDRERGEVRVLKDPKLTSPPWNSTAFEAAVQKAYVEQGYVKVVGEELVDGRRALVVRNAPPKWRSDNPRSATVAIVDAETFHLLRRTTSDGDLFTQDAVYEVRELLDEGPAVTARMAMSKHRGVKVTRRTKK